MLLATVTPAARSADEAAPAGQSQALSDQELHASIASADIVVVGRVSRIQAPSVPALTPQHQFVSEHNPDWQEAVIEVQQNLKGAKGASEVAVHFPASPDVAWASYPKFAVGQSGTFLLRQDRVSTTPTARLTHGPATAYVAPTRTSILSTEDAARVKALLAQ
ncbi:MAG: hypothetical protein JO261_01200 [Alphaproteobacteria bacterium]|nr:hypothetical protein [Alphaproteobacteria bacterium]MBV9692292.1 hypothetical protein [Alphaproteobacteria bacterium]